MPLRFDFGPFEKLRIGRSVISNSHVRAFFVVEGDMPLLRDKDFLEPERAENSLQRLYCCIQQMYLEEALEKHQGAYLELGVQTVAADPALYPEIQLAHQLVMDGQYYKALKRLRRLIGERAFVVDRSEPTSYVRRPG